MVPRGIAPHRSFRRPGNGHAFDGPARGSMRHFPNGSLGGRARSVSEQTWRRIERGTLSTVPPGLDEALPNRPLGAVTGASCTGSRGKRGPLSADLRGWQGRYSTSSSEFEDDSPTVRPDVGRGYLRRPAVLQATPRPGPLGVLEGVSTRDSSESRAARLVILQWFSRHSHPGFFHGTLE